MTYRAKVKDGVVVLPGGVKLPDGTEVTVHVPPAAPPASGPAKKSFGENMAELAKWAEGLGSTLPPDLAENHDHYLHGAPKRNWKNESKQD
jgi:hypothetical protein